MQSLPVFYCFFFEDRKRVGSKSFIFFHPLMIQLLSDLPSYGSELRKRYRLRLVERRFLEVALPDMGDGEHMIYLEKGKEKVCLGDRGIRGNYTD